MRLQIHMNDNNILTDQVWWTIIAYLMVANYKLSLEQFYFLHLTDINLTIMLSLSETIWSTMSVYFSLPTADNPSGVNSSGQYLHNTFQVTFDLSVHQIQPFTLALILWWQRNDDTGWTVDPHVVKIIFIHCFYVCVFWVNEPIFCAVGEGFQLLAFLAPFF